MTGMLSCKPPENARKTKFRFIALLRIFKQRCHPEWSEAKSRDLRTKSLLI